MTTPLDFGGLSEKALMTGCMLLGWLLAVFVLRVSYQRGSETWQHYSDGTRNVGQVTLSVSDFAAEFAVATVAFVSIVSHIWLSPAFTPSGLIPFGPWATVAALGFAFTAPIFYCRWQARRLPIRFGRSEEGRMRWARGYSFYWLYGTMLLIGLGIEAAIIYSNWEQAVITIEEQKALITTSITQLRDHSGDTAAAQGYIEAVIAHFIRFSRAVFDMLNASLVPFIASLIVLYLFIGGSGFGASFTSGGTLLVYALVAVLGGVSLLMLWSSYSIYAPVAEEVNAGLHGGLDKARSSVAWDIIRRRHEIQQFVDDVRDIAGFVHAISTDRGSTYLVLIVLQTLATRLVMVASMRRARIARLHD